MTYGLGRKKVAQRNKYHSKPHSEGELRMKKGILKKFSNVYTSTPSNVQFIDRNKTSQLLKAEKLIRGIVRDISDKKSMAFNPRNAVERIANRIRDYYRDN